VNPEEAAGLLGRSQLFSRLGEGLLRDLVGQASTRSYRKGAMIFYQGDAGDALYVLAEGRVKVFVTSKQGEEMVLATLAPPDAVGEVALFDDGPRSASVEALDAVTALAFARSTLLDLLHTTPDAADAVLRSAGSLLRRLTGQAADLVFLDLEGRVAKLLVGIAERSAQDVEHGVALDLGVTQTDLAAMVGGSRQSVNQILHALEGRRFLALEGRSVTILDLDALRHRAGL
jgi:CRP/FNR family transcriptional regulator, cyclic AMP receptor protein